MPVSPAIATATSRLPRMEALAVQAQERPKDEGKMKKPAEVISAEAQVPLEAALPTTGRGTLAASDSYVRGVAEVRPST
jgi:hypothetical protein